MKKCVLFFLFSFQVAAVWAQQADRKPGLSPLTQKYLHDFQQVKNENIAPEGYLYKKYNGEVYTSSLIQVTDAAAAGQGIEAIGGKIGTKAGNIWTVQIPFNQVNAFVEIQGISYIEMDQPVRPSLDIARKTTRVDSVHKGINLPMKYSGDGVIVGVIDFGFDYNHPSLYDTLHGKYRVKRVWELNGNGTPPPGYIYGNEITDTTLIKAQGTDNAEQTHGTCVAGMAAGSGFGSVINNKYRGMAYDAEMVFVGVRRDTIAQQWLQGSFTDFVDGINYIFNYAASVGKPCVVNVSWGSQSGPHDGSTLFNLACNNMTGPGKILVMSAGNEGEEKIHLAKTFTPADTAIRTFLKFSSGVYKRTWVDIWGEPGKSFCGKVTLYSNNIAGDSTNVYCIDNGIHDEILMGVNGLDTCFVQFINTTAAPNNGRPRMTIDIYNKATDSVGVSLMGTDGAINAWNEYYYYGYTYGYQCSFDSLMQPWAVNGNTASTVSDMGAGDSILLVGAYASKVAWTDINGLGWSYAGYVPANKLVPFSSRGPMIDGRIKPDITAPGMTIATAVSSYDTAYTETGSNSQLTVSSYLDPVLNKKFYYSEFSGTSASAPAASGIVALMLQAKPTLGPQEVKDIIFATAIKDVHTGALPAAGNNNWGHGKINAYGAMKYILANTAVYNYSGKKLDCELFPNPNDGSFTISYESDKKRNLQIEVYNMLGLKLSSQKWEVTNGANAYALDLTQKSSGVYFIRVLSEEGAVSIKTEIKTK